MLKIKQNKNHVKIFASYKGKKKDPIIKKHTQWMRLFSIDKVFDQFADNNNKKNTHIQRHTQQSR